MQIRLGLPNSIFARCQIWQNQEIPSVLRQRPRHRSRWESRGDHRILRLHQGEGPVYFLERRLSYVPMDESSLKTFHNLKWQTWVQPTLFDVFRNSETGSFPEDCLPTSKWCLPSQAPKMRWRMIPSPSCRNLMYLKLLERSNCIGAKRPIHIDPQRNHFSDTSQNVGDHPNEWQLWFLSGARVFWGKLDANSWNGITYRILLLVDYANGWW